MLVSMLFALAAIVVVCFGIVLFVGAPWLPTLKPQITSALDLLDLKPGQTMLELGSGDGRVLIAAAERGWNVVGYELNPILAFVGWIRTRRYSGRVRVVWGDYWLAQWPKADGIFTFLHSRYMRKLDKKITQYSHKPICICSFAFRIPNRSPQAEKAGVYLYLYK